MAAESKNIEKQHNGDGDDWPRGLIKRKPRIKWTKGLHQYFVKAVAQLGGPYGKYNTNQKSVYRNKQNPIMASASAN